MTKIELVVNSDKDSYVSGGLHGVGVSVVNVIHTFKSVSF
jgi:DNA gyrase/topoisomerase IV subunit B